MANLTSINVSGCDNELIILAYGWSASYEIANIKSGNYNTVDVTINLSAGAFTETGTWDGVNGPLHVNVDQHLPAGNYSLLLLGVNWGGPTQFTATLHFDDHTSAPFSLSSNSNGASGLVWNPGPISFEIASAPVVA